MRAIALQQAEHGGVDIAHIGRMGGGKMVAIDGVELAELMQLCGRGLFKEPVVDGSGFFAEGRECAGQRCERIGECDVSQRVEPPAGCECGAGCFDRAQDENAEGDIAEDRLSQVSRSPSGLDTGRAHAGEGEEAGSVDKPVVEGGAPQVLAACEFCNKDDKIRFRHAGSIADDGVRLNSEKRCE